MAKVKTWIWIVVGVVAIGILGIVALAAAGLWFVRSHVEIKPMTTAAATSDFEAVRAKFTGTRPLIELDERGDFIRANTDRPNGTVRPQTLNVMAFGDDDDKVVRMELPFWLLRLKSSGSHFSLNGESVDLARMHLTVEDLERYGPALILDHKDRKGTRVLVWTQ